MPRHQHAIRIVVGTDFGPRSAVWRIWSSGNEIYATPRSIASEVKTSLHSSGIFRQAFTEEAQGQYLAEGEDRLWFRWSQPPDFHSGARLLLEVIAPTDELTVPAEEPASQEKAKLCLVEAALTGGAVALSLLITDPGVEVPSHPRPETDGPSWLLDSWTLPDGRTVWVVASHQELDAGFWNLVGEARAQMTSQMEVLEASLVGGHMRAFVLAYANDLGVMRYFDLSGDPPQSSS